MSLHLSQPINRNKCDWKRLMSSLTDKSLSLVYFATVCDNSCNIVYSTTHNANSGMYEYNDGAIANQLENIIDLVIFETSHVFNIFNIWCFL